MPKEKRRRSMQNSTIFKVPYHRHPDGPSGHYVVQFDRKCVADVGSAILKHLRHVGESFELETYQLSLEVFGYHASLNENLLQLVRSDQNVEKVEDDLGQTNNDLEDDERRPKPQEFPPIPSELGYEASHNKSSHCTGSYLVYFHPRRTLAEHLDSVGRIFSLVEWSVMKGYAAKLEGDILARVRRDPGVRLIEDDPTNRATDMQYPCYTHYAKTIPGYTVSFRPNHTFELHLAFHGFYYEREETYKKGYSAELTDEQFAEVLMDPGVDLVESTTVRGRWH